MIMKKKLYMVPNTELVGMDDETLMAGSITMNSDTGTGTGTLNDDEEVNGPGMSREFDFLFK